MKKKSVKKLVLSKEVLYKIADGSLELIQGGDAGTADLTVPGGSHCSPCTYPT